MNIRFFSLAAGFASVAPPVLSASGRYGPSAGPGVDADWEWRIVHEDHHARTSSAELLDLRAAQEAARRPTGRA